MFVKAILLFALIFGVLAQEKLTEEQRNKFREILQNECRKNGGAPDVAETVGKNFVNCIKGFINPQTIMAEIEAAKPNGALDEVFKKYCAKSNELKNCTHTFLLGVKPCMAANLKEYSVSASDACGQIIDFVCYKDGDRIALFIAEHGPECFQEKFSGVQECFEKAKNDISYDKSEKSLTLNEQCAKFDELSECIVKSLEECNTPTPGNMAEALFRFMRKGSPCKSVVKN